MSTYNKTELEKVCESISRVRALIRHAQRQNKPENTYQGYKILLIDLLNRLDTIVKLDYTDEQIKQL